jgi:type I restriction enzyme M protein
MIDARSVHRKVTRKIYDFSPEQLKNLTSIVWLYRGQRDRFVQLVAEHLQNCIVSGRDSLAPITEFKVKLMEATGKILSFLKGASDERATSALSELESTAATLGAVADSFSKSVRELEKACSPTKQDMKSLRALAEKAVKNSEASHDLIRQIDHLAKFFSRAVEMAEKVLGAKENGDWSSREVKAAVKALDEARYASVEQLKLVRYFYRHAHWLQERFPGAELRDVEGLVKLVAHAELEKNDWSLTPGRYVGVAPEVEDEDFDYEETLREIHVELQDLNSEAALLSAKIAKNFEGLGI